MTIKNTTAYWYKSVSDEGKSVLAKSPEINVLKLSYYLNQGILKGEVSLYH
jgi:hypothetical protein